MRVSLSDEARDDVTAAVDWYIAENAFAAADNFTDELEQTIALVLQFPGLGTRRPHNTRMFPLQTFPYVLIYRQQPELPPIIAVAHDKQRPRYWAGRR